jgi:transcriptional regulator with PAS, ATPase and Fis domain
MNILLAWLGMTDIRAAQNEKAVGLGPIAQAVASREFDRVELLSNFQKEQNLFYLKWLQQQTNRSISFHSISLTGPTNFGEIYEAVVATIENLRKKHGSDVSLAFHLSPGTPAMAAVWILLSKTRYPAELIESSKQEGVKTVSIPFDISAEFLPDLLRRPDEQLERLTGGMELEAPEFGDIIHRSTQMKAILALARRVSFHSVPVLIEGESGTGKELLARAIHKASQRSNQPFVAVNCGAIPAELVESELFGHEKGAFTGAHQKRDGHFVKANGGTIFLDEIGELPLPAQIKILRVLQEREVVPLGTSLPKKIDLRVISATNRNLINEVAEGNFREDLFYRLAVLVLNLPPLREREGDIGLMLDDFLKKLNQENTGTVWLEDKKLSASARNLLINHHWPGNVRELQNTLLRAAVFSSGEKISEIDVRRSIFPTTPKQGYDVLDHQLGNGFSLPGLIEKVARHYLDRALEQAHGNKSEAAKLVGLPSYQTLTNWLTKYKVSNGT